MDSLRANRVGIKVAAARGTPLACTAECATVPPQGGFKTAAGPGTKESVNVRIRRDLDLYAYVQVCASACGWRRAYSARRGGGLCGAKIAPPPPPPRPARTG